MQQHTSLGWSAVPLSTEVSELCRNTRRATHLRLNAQKCTQGCKFLTPATRTGLFFRLQMWLWMHEPSLSPVCLLAENLPARMYNICPAAWNSSLQYILLNLPSVENAGIILFYNQFTLYLLTFILIFISIFKLTCLLFGSNAGAVLCIPRVVQRHAVQNQVWTVVLQLFGRGIMDHNVCLTQSREGWSHWCVKLQLGTTTWPN